jgi:hypothetical protein
MTILPKINEESGAPSALHTNFLKSNFASYKESLELITQSVKDKNNITEIFSAVKKLIIINNIYHLLYYVILNHRRNQVTDKKVLNKLDETKRLLPSITLIDAYGLRGNLRILKHLESIQKTSKENFTFILEALHSIKDEILPLLTKELTSAKVWEEVLNHKLTPKKSFEFFQKGAGNSYIDLHDEETTVKVLGRSYTDLLKKHMKQSSGAHIECFFLPFMSKVSKIPLDILTKTIFGGSRLLENKKTIAKLKSTYAAIENSLASHRDLDSFLARFEDIEYDIKLPVYNFIYYSNLSRYRTYIPGGNIIETITDFSNLYSKTIYEFTIEKPENYRNDLILDMIAVFTKKTNEFKQVILEHHSKLLYNILLALYFLEYTHIIDYLLFKKNKASSKEIDDALKLVNSLPHTIEGNFDEDLFKDAVLVNPFKPETYNNYPRILQKYYLKLTNKIYKYRLYWSTQIHRITQFIFSTQYYKRYLPSWGTIQYHKKHSDKKWEEPTINYNYSAFYKELAKEANFKQHVTEENKMMELFTYKFKINEVFNEQ